MPSIISASKPLSTRAHSLPLPSEPLKRSFAILNKGVQSPLPFLNTPTTPCAATPSRSHPFLSMRTSYIIKPSTNPSLPPRQNPLFTPLLAREYHPRKAPFPNPNPCFKPGFCARSGRFGTRVDRKLKGVIDKASVFRTQGWLVWRQHAGGFSCVSSLINVLMVDRTV